jgi:bifunctional non-homologous end joining protein LigD
VEFKWDGIRVIAAAGAGRVRLISRNGNDLTAGYPELAAGETPARLAERGPVLLDGELVVLDSGGRPSFERLQQRMHLRSPGPELLARAPVVLYVFDVLYLAGRSLLGEPYDERREVLAGLVLDRIPHVGVPGGYTDLPAAQLLEVARAHGLEGVVSKRRHSRYEPGRRSPAWLKTPLITTMEVLVGGWTAGRGRRGGTIGALLVGAYDRDGRLRYLGRVGTGFTEAMLTDLAARLAPLTTPASLFGEPLPAAEARGARWVRPQLVGEVVYRTLTGERRLRHAAWRGLRPDRDPDEVTL